MDTALGLQISARGLGQPPHPMKVLIVTEPAMLADPKDERLARLVGAVAPLGAVTLLVMGKEAVDGREPPLHWRGVAEQIRLTGQQTAQQSGEPPWSAEDMAQWILRMAGGFSHIVAAASTLGAEVLPRVAALLDRAMVTGVVQICAADVFVRPILAGNALTTVQVTGQPVFLTLQPSAFAPAAYTDPPLPPAQIPAPGLNGTLGLSRLLARTGPPAHSGQIRRTELSSAAVVVAGGGGLEKGGSFALIESLAHCLGAAVGASRGAVDAELAPIAWQIGQTGQIIAPELYIGIGISGAVQHLAGIKGAKTIVAINQDPTAPLMRIADFSLEADLYEAVPALIGILQNKCPPRQE
ncbi:MAG: FAD-binding protein [Magnetococcus sp. MYC-9]